MLVRLKKKTLYSFAGQEKQLPVDQVKQFDPRGLVLLQVKRDVREGLDREVGWGDALVNCPLKDAEIAQS
jgi:hypothetical protein